MKRNIILIIIACAIMITLIARRMNYEVGTVVISNRDLTNNRTPKEWHQSPGDQVISENDRRELQEDEWREESRRKILDYFKDVSVHRESRWHIEFDPAFPAPQDHRTFSKFLLGTADITIDELRAEWPTWDDAERDDFIYNVGGASRKLRADVYRYIVSQRDRRMIDKILIAIVHTLPKAEAVVVTREACIHDPTNINYWQAYTITKDTGLQQMMIDRLMELCSETDINHIGDDYSMSYSAYAALTMVEYILAIGTQKDLLSGPIDQLCKHPHPDVRRIIKEVAKGKRVIDVPGGVAGSR